VTGLRAFTSRSLRLLWIYWSIAAAAAACVFIAVVGNVLAQKSYLLVSKTITNLSHAGTMERLALLIGAVIVITPFLMPRRWRAHALILFYICVGNLIQQALRILDDLDEWNKAHMRDIGILPALDSEASEEQEPRESDRGVEHRKRRLK
jgi:hypothetical protein